MSPAIFASSNASGLLFGSQTIFTDQWQHDDDIATTLSYLTSALLTSTFRSLHRLLFLPAFSYTFRAPDLVWAGIMATNPSNDTTCHCKSPENSTYLRLLRGRDLSPPTSMHRLWSQRCFRCPRVKHNAKMDHKSKSVP